MLSNFAKEYNLSVQISGSRSSLVWLKIINTVADGTIEATQNII